MKDELFQELVESIREAGGARRGQAKPSRQFECNDVDVKELRERFDLSQPKFAALLGISVGTLRGWEQKQRRPEGPARVLLRVAAKHPEAVLDAVGPSSRDTSAAAR
ncbi:helix-turn-helix domain-containing protein [Myxococcota bacterium]|nr:helix-turn-helix domain-containing protein [Myxococcota bacterium]